MKPAKQPSTKLMPEIPRGNEEPVASARTRASTDSVRQLLVAVAVVSFMGFADALYLTADHYFALPLPCALTHGCETVLTSPWAMVGSIPLAFFGVVYYLLQMFLALYIYTDETIERRLLLALYSLSIVGFLMSIAFMSLQVFVIKAVCLYCAFSALLTVLLLILGIRLVRSRK